MMCESVTAVLSLYFCGLALGSAVPGVHNPKVRRGPEPTQYVDPSTISTCTWWLDNEATPGNCEGVPGDYGISFEDFRRWNPVITEDCENFNAFQSYCVEAPAGGDPPPEPTPTDDPGEPGNGIETPSPTQPGMIDNCNKFYFVERGGNCEAIAQDNGITVDLFVEWNSGVGDDCTGMWADTYVCVGIIGFTPPTSTTEPPSDPTDPGNGIETPTPTQPDMVGNCDAFHLVRSGEGCAVIASRYRISQTQFRTWNPSVGTDCTGLWANAYVCVSIIGHSPPPTTTAGNGITTPTPTQTGMIENCDSFHRVTTGQDCATIARLRGITLANFVRWNPAVKSDCSGLWANTYACVGII